MSHRATNLSGTTLINTRLFDSYSNNSSRGGTPEHYGDKITKTTDRTRVPVEEDPSGFVEEHNRVNKKGQTVSVHNHGNRTNGT